MIYTAHYKKAGNNAPWLEVIVDDAISIRINNIDTSIRFVHENHEISEICKIDIPDKYYRLLWRTDYLHIDKNYCTLDMRQVKNGNYPHEIYICPKTVTRNDYYSDSDNDEVVDVFNDQRMYLTYCNNEMQALTDYLYNLLSDKLKQIKNNTELDVDYSFNDRLYYKIKNKTLVLYDYMEKELNNNLRKYNIYCWELDDDCEKYHIKAMEYIAILKHNNVYLLFHDTLYLTCLKNDSSDVEIYDYLLFINDRIVDIFQATE